MIDGKIFFASFNNFLLTIFSYYLNGNWAVDHHGERSFAGAKWLYDRRPYESEYLTTKGPINEDLIIEV